jgi:hypothetical protein
MKTLIKMLITVFISFFTIYNTTFAIENIGLEDSQSARIHISASEYNFDQFTE